MLILSPISWWFYCCVRKSQALEEENNSQFRFLSNFLPFLVENFPFKANRSVDVNGVKELSCADFINSCSGNVTKKNTRPCDAMRSQKTSKRSVESLLKSAWPRPLFGSARIVSNGKVNLSLVFVLHWIWRWPLIPLLFHPFLSLFLVLIFAAVLGILSLSWVPLSENLTGKSWGFFISTVCCFKFCQQFSRRSQRREKCCRQRSGCRFQNGRVFDKAQRIFLFTATFGKYKVKFKKFKNAVFATEKFIVLLKKNVLFSGKLRTHFDGQGGFRLAGG